VFGDGFRHDEQEIQARIEREVWNETSTQA
jgi:hypothetical protein